ncbi:LTA synthase family protein [Sphingobacterium gobiense]|uniref:Sulfatase n=1 Tax=Sphingobacterium gobiense TaxID=1382456 RepID=A0A2S9JV91_9SPHI|nr:alkaline phosphatase family protein [Sphingobacterium gobiense]PRD57197.1 sulfatase [Sphingobacterium gobiense]
MQKKLAQQSASSFFLALFCYWLLLSFLDRIAFAVAVLYKIEDIKDIGYAFLYGLKLDFSLAAYLTVLPFLVFTVQHLWLRNPVSPWILRVYVILLTFLFVAVTVANLPLYEAWGEKISKRALLLGLDTIGGVSSSVDLEMIGQAAFVAFIFLACAYCFYRSVVLPRQKYSQQPLKRTVLLFWAGAAVLFLFIRGGYVGQTLNQSSVYFSDDNKANHLAVNTYWSFFKDLTKSTKKNPYQFMDAEEAYRLCPSTQRPNVDSIEQVLTTNRPNVILIILESMVAQIFEDLGGEKDVTKGLKRLMDEGVSFRRAYAAADRSDKGMIAVLSGFPAQGPESIIQHIPKHEKLPGIGQIFDSLGYATSFYHGGHSEFYNFKSYMFAHGTQRVVDNTDFPITVQRNSWGAYDHVVAERMLEDLKEDGKPFFSIFYTLVNHEPFHLSSAYHFGNNTKANAYRSTAYYTDTMLCSFIEKIKIEPWYENTIVVVTSDHGHVYPLEKYGLERPERYHIPLFLFGGALRKEWCGKKVEDVVSQLDIAGTLAHFVGVSSTRFKYSQDLFSKNREHMAFYNANGNFGIINNDGTVSYDMLRRDIGYSTFPKDSIRLRDSLMQIAKGYYHTVFNDFLSY